MILKVRLKVTIELNTEKVTPEENNTKRIVFCIFLSFIYMVYFVCNRCQETIRKNKVDEHSNRCGSNSYSCVDCGKDFSLSTARGHNTCITEEEKYQGKLYNAGKVPYLIKIRYI